MTLVHKLSRFEDQNSNVLKKEQKIKSPKIQLSRMMDPIAKRLSLFGPIQQESIASVKDSHLDHLSFLFFLQNPWPVFDRATLLRGLGPRWGALFYFGVEGGC